MKTLLTNEQSEALQQLEDETAIREGLADAKSGRVMTCDESRARTLAALDRLSE